MALARGIEGRVTRKAGAANGDEHELGARLDEDEGGEGNG